jgi:hypothetical protein
MNVPKALSSSILLVNEYFDGFGGEWGSVGSQSGTESNGI